MVRQYVYPGIDDRPRGEGHHNHKLTENDVIAIRRKHHAGVSAKTLAYEHHVRVATIWNVIHYRSWKHV